MKLAKFGDPDFSFHFGKMPPGEASRMAAWTGRAKYLMIRHFYS